MARKSLKESPLDQFRQWLEHLKIKSAEIPVIVESQREEKALRGLKITNILIISQPLELWVEKIAQKHKEVILLLDVDKRGRDLFDKVKSKLEQVGVKIDQRFLQFIYHLPVKRIEGLPAYINKHLVDTPRKDVL